MSSWRYMVIRIGEQCAEYGGQADPEAHIETCSSFLLRELEHAGDEILMLLMQCAEELPHKSPFYGTVVGLLNLEDEELGRKVVDHTHANLQVALDSENCNKLRTLLRFLTVLMCSGVILPGALIEVFETLLSSAATTIDEEGGNPAWQPRADFYILCILACLPWGGLELFERAAEELERVMVGIEAYLSIRKHVLEPAFLAFNSSEQADGMDEEGVDMLEDLWGRIRSLADNGWKIDSVPQPHLAFEARLVTGKSHDFGPLTCAGQPDLPSTASDVTIGRQRHEADMKYPQRIRRLRIFPVSKTEENLQPIDRFVVEEYLLDVLFYLNGCRKECAAYMVGLPVPFRYEYIMAETIFSQLLLLPRPPFKIIYYTLVIVDLCKALPAAFPRVVAGAVRALFDRVGDLDMECRTRLVLWFSHHLSNFQFTWPWEEWAHVLDLPKWSPQRVFTQEILEKEMRLSYWEKIKQSMQNAPTLEELLPPKGGPCFKYSGESQAENSEAEVSLSTELTNMVRGKTTARDVHTWLEEKVLPLHGQKAAIEIVVQTLLYIGSKSFTHLVTVLERYGQVITKLGFDQDNQVLVIEEIAKLWKNSAQMTALAIDRMMGYRIISNLAIVSWVFSAGNVEQFHTSDLPWEILRNALNKTYNRTSDLRKEVALAETSAQKAVESSIKVQAELETAESLVEGIDAEEAQIEAENKVKQLKEAADRAKEEESSAQGSLETKKALLIRALHENEALFIAVYKNFSDVLMKRLTKEHIEKQGESSTPDHKDPMAIDSEEPVAMDADDDDERRNQRSVKSNGLHAQEEEQWHRCTLGQVQSLTRQYATEVWPHIERLDAEVFTGDVHPSFLRAVYSGLRRPLFHLEGL